MDHSARTITCEDNHHQKITEIKISHSRLAQLAEQLFYTKKAEGSSPLMTTNCP